MPHRTPQVLYIDDDADLADRVTEALAARGCLCHQAGSAAEGLARLRAGDIDVVALDHDLPDGSGLDVLAALQAMDDLEQHPAVLYVTGPAELANAVEALRAGAFDFVPKSDVDNYMTLLLTAIDHAVDNVRLNRAKALAERETQIAREHAEMLLGEVNHRVANSLAMVAALVGLQAHAVEDEEARRALSETQARIQAIAGVHRHLYTSDDVRSVQVADYLGSLIGELETSMQADDSRASIRLDIEAFALPTEKVASLGVIVTELVTNAIKYAYADREPGEVRVRMRRHGEEVQLSVEDDGIGWTGTGRPQGTGLGSRIVKAMAISLDAEVSYGTGPGTRVQVTFSR